MIIYFCSSSIFFSQYTEQINTSSFNNSIIPPSTHIDGLDEGSISYQNMNSTEFINNKRELAIPVALKLNNFLKERIK